MFEKGSKFQQGKPSTIKGINNFYWFSKNILHQSYSQRGLTGQDVFVKRQVFKFMKCLFIGFGAYFIQHMGSFNYGKIRTMGAVLVAISIPIFTSQLEKSREATDLSNIRAAYAECSAALLTGANDAANGVTYTAPTNGADDTATATKDVKLNQKVAEWATDATTEIAGKKVSELPETTGSVTITVKADGTWTIVEKKTA